MGALSGKTVLLVTHQVDFLPAFDSVLLMSEGEILRAATYDESLVSSQEFQNLVNAHNDTAGSEIRSEFASSQIPRTSKEEIQKIYSKEQLEAPSGEQLIKQEEREAGDTGLKPYIQYLKQGKGFLYFSFATMAQSVFIVGQLVRSYWLAKNLQICLPQVWDREKVVIIPDHYIFTNDERANRNVDILRDFCSEKNIKYFYDIKDLGNFKANPDYN